MHSNPAHTQITAQPGGPLPPQVTAMAISADAHARPHPPSSSLSLLCVSSCHTSPLGPPLPVCSSSGYMIDLGVHPQTSAHPIPFLVLGSERTRAIPTPRAVTGSRMYKLLGLLLTIYANPPKAADPRAATSSDFKYTPEPGSLSPPALAPRSSHLSLPCHPGYVVATGRGQGVFGVPGNILSFLTPRATSPSLHGPQGLLLHDRKGGPGHRCVAVGTGPREAPDKLHF